MKDKRRHPRLKLDLPIVLRHAGRLIPATALNISCGGMYVSTNLADIVDNAPVEVIFDLDEKSKDISLRGRVARVETKGDATGFGMQFTNLFSTGRKTIQEYINKNLN